VLVRHEISRLPQDKRTHIPGSSTTPGPAGYSLLTHSSCVAFRCSDFVGARNNPSFTARGWPMRRPVNASQPRGWLLRDPGAMWFANPSSWDSHLLLLASIRAHPNSRNGSATNSIRRRTRPTDPPRGSMPRQESG
jgi:hypothetical protein